jgi:two-component system sensor histidine kinase KdpD
MTEAPFREFSNGGAKSRAAQRWARFARASLPYLYSAFAVVAAGIVAGAFSIWGPLAQVSIVFVGAAMGSALFWGIGPSLFAVALSLAACAFFFYAPYYDFRVEDWRDRVDMIVFTTVAVMFSRMAGKARRHANEAQRREQFVVALHAFSQRLASIHNLPGLLADAAGELAALLRARVVLVARDAGDFAEGRSPGADPPAAAIETGRALLSVGSAGNQARAGHWVAFPLVVGARAVAALLCEEAGEKPFSFGDPQVRAMLDQAAIAIERMRLVREVEDARVEARTEKLREALLNSISHDLKTPLSAIVGAVTALQEGERVYDAQARADLLGAIREESEHLSSHIENVLDLSRLRAGALRPRLELIELSDIIGAALQRTRRVMGDRRIELVLPANLPMLRLDLFLMQHALVKLLENAAKYAAPGTVLRISAAAAGDVVKIDVTDAGPGIPADELERVFDRFYRGAMGDRNPGGSGLGLAICRAFIEANGGSVEAISMGAGSGATFRICLPISAQDRLLEAAASDE